MYSNDHSRNIYYSEKWEKAKYSSSEEQLNTIVIDKDIVHEFHILIYMWKVKKSKFQDHTSIIFTHICTHMCGKSQEKYWNGSIKLLIMVNSGYGVTENLVFLVFTLTYSFNFNKSIVTYILYKRTMKHNRRIMTWEVAEASGCRLLSPWMLLI